MLRDVSTRGYRREMEVRFYRDDDTGEPHFREHGVTETEVREAFDNVIDDGGGSDRSRALIGRTEGRRYIRVVYAPDPVPRFGVRHHRVSARALVDARAAT